MNEETDIELITDFEKSNLNKLSEKDKYSVSLLKYVKPTHFITLSLNQARWIGHGNHGIWVRGDDAIYTKTHKGFIRSLSKRLWSRTSWKLHRAMLRSACVIEGGSHGVRHHLHMIVAKPDHVEEEKFRIMAIRSAANNAWIMGGSHAVNIQQLDDCEQAIAATCYSIKHGLGRVTLS